MMCVSDFSAKGSIVQDCSDTKQDSWDDGESSENIISREPPIHNGFNLYGSLHWW